MLNSWVSATEGDPEYASKSALKISVLYLITPLRTGELQIPWAEVLNTFNGVYLSWDPRTWENSLTFHG